MHRSETLGSVRKQEKDRQVKTTDFMSESANKLCSILELASVRIVSDLTRAATVVLSLLDGFVMPEDLSELSSEAEEELRIKKGKNLVELHGLSDALQEIPCV